MNAIGIRMNTFRRAAAYACCAALLSPAMPAIGATDEPLETVTVAYETAPRERVLDGTVEAVNQATVSAETSGRVLDILQDVDDVVEAGAILIRLADTEQRAALDSARAALGEAEARHAEAASEFERVDSMFANATVARARHDQARANLDAAVARLAAARAAVVGAEQQLDYTVVRAPYAGIVSARHVEVGELVRPGAALVSELSLENLRVNVDVPQGMIDTVRRIGRARIYTGDLTIDAAGFDIFPVADPAANTFRVRVPLRAGGAALLPGMLVKVGFVVGETERLFVPSAAVVHRSELTAVYVVAGAAVTLRQIRAGGVQGDRVEVLAGLEAGETVALDPLAAGARRRESER